MPKEIKSSLDVEPAPLAAELQPQKPEKETTTEEERMKNARAQVERENAEAKAAKDGPDEDK